MTRREALRRAAERLGGAGIDNPRLEARLLLAHALGLSQASVLADQDREVAPGPYLALIDRRAAREPLAQILGHREFWSLRFAVSPATLIPRPESETLIEAAVAAFPDRAAVRRVLDLGTGTGCLLLAALTEFPDAFGVGIDAVPAGLAAARRNMADLGLAGRAALVCGCWADSLAGRFELVLCNPPYVPTAEIGRLMPDVARYEPISALDGGVDGLDAYRAVIPQVPGLLGPGGAAIVELGTGQALAVAAMAKSSRLTTSWLADLAGVPRALVLRNTPP